MLNLVSHGKRGVIFLLMDLGVVGLAVPAALWNCVCGFANVFKVIQRFS